MNILIDPILAILELILAYPFMVIGGAGGAVAVTKLALPYQVASDLRLLSGVGFGALLGFLIDRSLGDFFLCRRAFYGCTSRNDYGDTRTKLFDFSYFYGAKESDSALFMRCAFSMFAKIAKADGHIDRREIDVIEQLMKSTLYLDKKARRKAITIFHEAVKGPASFWSLCEEAYERFKDRPVILERLIVTLFEIAGSDGTVSSEEDAMIWDATQRFHLAPEIYEELRQRYSPSSYTHSEGARVANSPYDGDSHYYSVLGVTTDAPVREIKSHFRALAKANHPDRLKTAEAAVRFREIMQAYDYIRTVRHF